MIKTRIKSTLAVLLVLIMLGMIGYTAYCFDDTEIKSTLLKQGASGSDVKAAQNKLIALGYLNDKADGIFGSKTKDAVTRFQRDKGLQADGIIGDKTAKALGITVSSSSSSNGNSGYSGSDVYLLAKCIYAESRGEPYIGQVAVGAVVLNRVKSSKFPNSISGVIYEPWAFTAVHDGQINLTPDASAKRAAQDAMNGWDPTNGCIYYYNPDVATSAWIWSRKIMLVIGRHNFAV